MNKPQKHNTDRQHPIIRFKDFEEPWLQKQLSILGNTYAGLTGKRSADFNRGNAFFITYKQVYDSPTIEKARGKVRVSPSEKQNQVKFGDLLVTASSETPDEVGMTAVFINKNSRPYLNSFCFGFRPHSLKVLDPYFARYLFRSPAIRRKIIKLAQGSTRFNISRSAFLQLKIYLPSLPEQRKIAAFFSTLDDLIENIKKQKEKLEELKKGLMQRLFPKKGERIPELRFKGFEGEWREVRLGEVLEKFEKLVKELKYVGTLPILSSTRKGIFLQEEYFNKRIASNKNIKKYRVVPFGFFTYRAMSDEGIFRFNIQTLTQFGIISPAYPVFSIKSGYDKYFIYYYMNNNSYFKYKIFKFKQGGTRYALPFSKLQQITVSLPSLPEQRKIAKLLRSLEGRIQLKQRQLDRLEEFKKGLLQRMFV